MEAPERNAEIRSEGIRVALLCDYEIGLLERVLAPYFKMPGVKVRLLRRRRGDLHAPIKGINQIKLPGGLVRHDVETRIPGPIEEFVKTAFYLYLVLIQTPNLNNKDISLVHSRFLVPQGLAGVLLSKMLGVPHVVNADGTDVNRYLRRFPHAPMARYVLSNSRRAVAVSSGLEAELKAIGLSRVVLIENSVDTEVFAPGERTRETDMTILYTGRHDKAKGPQRIIASLGRIAKDHPGLRLLLTGEGPLRKELESDARSLGIADRCSFLGYVDDPEDVYKRAGIFVLPSESEGLSLSLLEAMSSGLACIASDIPGNRAIIEHGKDGLLFPLEDPGALDRCLRMIIEDPEGAREMGRAARAKIMERCSVARAAEKLLVLYRDVIDE